LDSRVRHTINLKICIDLLIWSQGPKEDFQKMKQRIALANISVVIST